MILSIKKLEKAMIAIIRNREKSFKTCLDLKTLLYLKKCLDIKTRFEL